MSNDITTVRILYLSVGLMRRTIVQLEADIGLYIFLYGNKP